MENDVTREKRTMLRLPPNLYAAIKERATVRLRSINKEMVALLMLGLANKAEETKALAIADKFIKKQTEKTRDGKA